MPLITIIFVENTIRWTSTAPTTEVYRYYYIYKDQFYEENN
jgi:hypothetical protein